MASEAPERGTMGDGQDAPRRKSVDEMSEASDTGDAAITHSQQRRGAPAVMKQRLYWILAASVVVALCVRWALQRQMIRRWAMGGAATFIMYVITDWFYTAPLRIFTDEIDCEVKVKSKKDGKEVSFVRPSLASAAVRRLGLKDEAFCPTFFMPASSLQLFATLCWRPYHLVQGKLDAWLMYDRDIIPLADGGAVAVDWLTRSSMRRTKISRASFRVVLMGIKALTVVVNPFVTVVAVVQGYIQRKGPEFALRLILPKNRKSDDSSAAGESADGGKAEPVKDKADGDKTAMGNKGGEEKGKVKLGSEDVETSKVSSSSSAIFAEAIDEALCSNTEASKKVAAQTLLVLIPGLYSDSGTFYVRGLAAEAHKRGYTVGVYLPRGAGKQELRTTKLWCGGSTDDFRAALSHMQAKHPKLRYTAAIGCSLGANVLVKYLGEEFPGSGPAPSELRLHRSALLEAAQGNLAGTVVTQPTTQVAEASPSSPSTTATATGTATNSPTGASTQFTAGQQQQQQSRYPTGHSAESSSVPPSWGSTAPPVRPIDVAVSLCNPFNLWSGQRRFASATLLPLIRPIFKQYLKRGLAPYADALAPVLSAAAVAAAAASDEENNVSETDVSSTPKKSSEAKVASPVEANAGKSTTAVYSGNEAFEAAAEAGIFDSGSTFDKWVMAPMFNYISPEDMIHSNSSSRFIMGVKAPLLVVQAADDPFVDSSAFDRIIPSLKPNVAFVESKTGTHLSFFEGMGLDQWLPPTTMDFVTEVLLDADSLAEGITATGEIKK